MHSRVNLTQSRKELQGQAELYSAFVVLCGFAALREKFCLWQLAVGAQPCFGLPYPFVPINVRFPAQNCTRFVVAKAIIAAQRADHPAVQTGRFAA